MKIKTLSVKINLKEDAKIIQQKRRPEPTHLQEQVRRNKEANKKQLFGKSHGNNRRLFCEPSSDNREKKQVSEDCTRFKKIN